MIKARTKKKIWRDEFYVTVYESAKAGMRNEEIAGVLGCTPLTFAQWCKTKRALADALARGRAKDKPTFTEYVYGRLPLSLKKVWKKINRMSEEANGLVKVQRILENKGEHVQQHLFIYAFCNCNFNASRALRKLGLSKATLNKWVESDPNFVALFEEIDWHKANFFEDALVKKIKAGDIHAIIFANKTFNRDRGYGEKTQVEVSGEVNHTHKILNEDVLSRLSLACRQELLQALRGTKALSVESAPVKALTHG